MPPTKSEFVLFIAEWEVFVETVVFFTCAFSMFLGEDTKLSSP